MNIDKELENEEDIKVPVIGEFTPKDKFIQFIGAKGNINFISNEAFIDGKYLSGLGLDGIKFKLTICDEGTVNFEEVDTNQTTKELRQRLLEVISEKTIVPSRNKMMIINELPFISVKSINDRQITLYLAVDHQRPIDKLASLLDDEEVTISDEQSSKLDALMSMFDDDQIGEKKAVDIDDVSTTEPVYDYNKQLQESFTKIKQEKIDELNKRLENKRKELSKFTQDVRLSTKKVTDAEDDIKLLESRLESLEPEVEFIGYYFNVSERLNEKTNLYPEISDLIRSKISKSKGINVEAFMKLFEDGEYHIRIGRKSGDIISEVTDYQNISEDVQKSLSKLGVKLSDGKLTYVGELSWGDIVNKMVKSGFSQDSEFDKQCGSNSYKAIQYGKVEPPVEEESTVEDAPSNNYEFQDEFKSKELKTYDQPTTLVVVGNVDHNENSNLNIYEDFIRTYIYVGDKKTKKSIETYGHISFMTLSEFEIWKTKDIEAMEDCESFLLKDFKGTIGVTAINQDGKFTTDFDLNEYLQYLDGISAVFLTLPEGTEIINMEDHQIPVDILRDIKIENIIK